MDCDDGFSMKVKGFQRREEQPYILGRRGEEILRSVHFYRYMAALDVAHLLFSPLASEVVVEIGGERRAGATGDESGAGAPR